MTNNYNIAVVLLNYNSEDDLFVSVKQVLQQKQVNLTTIIVDNASSPKTVENMKGWVEDNLSNTLSLSKEQLFQSIKDEMIKQTIETFVVYNNENKGYSAGNNIGIKLADYLNVDAVLIANPDMRFENEMYIYELAKVLFSDNQYFVTASKIIGLDGKDQSPLREATFSEELFWPKQLLPKLFKAKSYILEYDKEKIIEVPKIMGCSLMLKMDFLRTINYFDENVFLYSEEPILSALVKQNNGKIIFIPTVEAIHAHVETKKGNSSLRMLKMIKSRRYYLKKYSKYNVIQLFLLNISYSILTFLHFLKGKIV